MYIYRMETRECLACKEAVKGRIDKKFCSDYCRNAYKILSELNVSGKTKVTRTKLYDNGFDFQFFTSIYKTKTGNTYFYVYNEGYLTLENDTFLLIRKER